MPDDLETFWKVLEEAKESMKLEEAYRKAGFTEQDIKDEIYGSGDGSMLGAWILDEEKKLERIRAKRNSTKHFIKYYNSTAGQHLLLLQKKAEHQILTALWKRRRDLLPKVG